MAKLGHKCSYMRIQTLELSQKLTLVLELLRSSSFGDLTPDFDLWMAAKGFLGCLSLKLGRSMEARAVCLRFSYRFLF